MMNTEYYRPFFRSIKKIIKAVNNFDHHKKKIYVHTVTNYGIRFIVPAESKTVRLIWLNAKALINKHIYTHKKNHIFRQYRRVAHVCSLKRI